MSAAKLTLLPNARVQFSDLNGKPYAGGTVGFYIPGGFTPKDTWLDPYQNAANANPLTLDDSGSATIWGTGLYRQILKDSAGNQIWDQLALAPQLGAGAGELFLDSVAAGQAGLIAEGTTSLTLLGYATPGDGGGGVYIPASAGSGPGKFQSMDGQWWELAAVATGKGPLYPEQFGAKGDGATDDSTPFAQLIALGMAFQGKPGSIYGLASQLAISTVSHFSMSDITLKDLNPNSTSRKFVYGTGNTSVRMERVTILRNGSGASGSFASAGAIWIDTADVVTIVDVDVSGNNAGTGLRLVTCASGVVTRAYIHDMTAGTPSSANPGDGADQIAGIWLDGCTGVTVEAPNVQNLLTQCVDYTPENINTRGITFGGPGKAVSVTDGFVSNVDEAYDLSGDALFTGWQITACRAEYCRKFGFKAAVTASVGRFVNCYAYRCTLDGFYLQGTNTAVSPTTSNVHDVQCIGCIAEETGYNVGTYYPGFDTSGFRSDPGSADASYPRNCRFVDCRAFGGSNMKIGFNNSVGAAYIAQDRNRIINCTASDFTQLAQQGFVDGTSILGLSADQSISDNTDTAVVWDHVINSVDGLGFLTGGGTASLTLPYAGRFLVETTTTFNANATGNRSSWAVVNSARVPLTRDVRAANAISLTTPNFDFVWDFEAGDVLQILVNQTSGGSLGLNGGDTALRVTDLNSPQQIVVVT